MIERRIFKPSFTRLSWISDLFPKDHFSLLAQNNAIRQCKVESTLLSRVIRDLGRPDSTNKEVLKFQSSKEIAMVNCIFGAPYSKQDDFEKSRTPTPVTPDPERLKLNISV